MGTGDFFTYGGSESSVGVSPGEISGLCLALLLRMPSDRGACSGFSSGVDYARLRTAVEGERF